jgi:hypothetical protein
MPISFKHRINITGVDLPVQGKQEGRSAVNHNLDDSPGRKGSTAEFSQSLFQSPAVEIFRASHGRFFRNPSTVPL